MSQHHYSLHHQYHSTPSEEEDASVVFQSIQISIPVLPFIILSIIILILVIVRFIKHAQYFINWNVIEKSIKQQVVLLSLFIQLPLLAFYLYTLIGRTSGQRKHPHEFSLSVFLLLNGLLGGVVNFLQEQSLGFAVSMLGCFSASLFIKEAHVRTILLCLCFVIVVLVSLKSQLFLY